MSGKPSLDAMPAGTTSGTPQVLLSHHLKQLKLPTVLREYDKVARECARDGVDHPRYQSRFHLIPTARSCDSLGIPKSVKL